MNDEIQNTNPPCPYCGKPGTLNPSSPGIVPGKRAYYCTNPNCTAPNKPHNWWDTPMD
jgi:hypothetical protein